MKVEIKDAMLKITFSYDPTLVRKVKTLTGRSYHPKEKAWYCPDIKANRDKLLSFGFDIQESYIATEIISHVDVDNTKTMKVVLSNKLTIKHINYQLYTHLKDKLTLQNPKWIENERMGRWNRDTPKELIFFEEHKNKFIVPKTLINDLEAYDIKLNDKRNEIPVNFTFHGTLKPFQQIAEDKVLKYDFGVLSSPTGSGKTVMALSIIAKRFQKTLIIVHTKELLKQWIARIKTFLKIKNVGQIGDGKKIVGKEITVGMVQTIYNFGKEIKDEFGFIVVDECHRTPSRTFTAAVQMFNSKYVLGLSATMFRRDGLAKLIYWYIGNLVHEIKPDELIESGDILPLEIIWRNTEFFTDIDPVVEYTKVLSAITNDAERNMLICKDVAEEVKNNKGICLILSDRKYHCINLQKILMYNFNVYADTLTGDSTKNEKEVLEKNLKKNNVQVIIATGQLIGEGYDLPELSSLFLTTPIKYKGRLIQYVGRIRRPAKGKVKGRIFDYIDVKMEIFVRNAKYRETIYKKI